MIATSTTTAATPAVCFGTRLGGGHGRILLQSTRVRKHKVRSAGCVRRSGGHHNWSVQWLFSKVTSADADRFDDRSRGLVDYGGQDGLLLRFFFDHHTAACLGPHRVERLRRRPPPLLRADFANRRVSHKHEFQFLLLLLEICDLLLKHRFLFLKLLCFCLEFICQFSAAIATLRCGQLVPLSSDSAFFLFLR